MARPSRFLPWFSIFIASLGIGCSSTGDDDSSSSPTPPTGDATGPAIVFTLLEDGQPLGQDVPLTIALSDDSGISSATLNYRTSGTDYWGTSFFTEGPEGYSALIPASYVQAAGVDYYIKATDASFNRNVSYSPADGKNGPAHFATTFVAQSFPFFADFDPPSGDDSNWTLSRTGWTAVVAGFDNEANWELSQASSHSGAWAAFHGNGSAYQTADFLDYLISPPIDLSAAKSADLSWWEFDDLSAFAEHALMVSTTGTDPEEFTEVLAPLVPSDGAGKGWVKSRHVDLSAWIGESKVFFAFRYAGSFGDEWFIDDVSVTEAAPDIAVAGPVFAPAQIEPGGSSTVEFPLTNIGLASTGPLTARLEVEGATVEPSALSLAALATGQSTDAGPFNVILDPGFPDDSYATATLTVSDGSHTWQGTGRLQVGQPAVAHIEITHPFEDDIQLFLGYGDPEKPTYYQVIQQDRGGDTSGTFTWDVDLSGEGDALPPDTGAHRWFIQVWDDSLGNQGTLDVFRITQGGRVWESSGLPQTIPDDGSSLYALLPGQARFELNSQTTTPETVAPGNTVSLTFTLANRSAPPQGPLTGKLTTSSPDVSQLTPAQISFTYVEGAPTPEPTPEPTPGTTPEPGDDPTPSPTPGSTPEPTPTPITGTATPDKPFTFVVSARHADSSPLKFTLTLTDGTDTWTVPMEVPVPWPVLGGLEVHVEDPTAGGSGGNEALEPGAPAGLRLRIRNIGGLATFGAVTATVKLLSDTTGGASVDDEPVTLVDDTQSESGLEPGEGGKSTALVPVLLTGGEVGDSLQIEVTVTDGTLKLVEVRTLTVGDPPWNPITALSDPVGDSSSGAPDLDSGSFWREGTKLKMRWRFHYPFDIRESYLYSFLSDGPGYKYAIVYAYGQALFYQWIVNDDSTYWSRRYTAPASLYAIQPDPQTVETGIDLAEIQYPASMLYGGASAGSCGGTLACDYAPDASSSSTGLTRFWW